MSRQAPELHRIEIILLQTLWYQKISERKSLKEIYNLNLQQLKQEKLQSEKSLHSTSFFTLIAALVKREAVLPHLISL